MPLNRVQVQPMSNLLIQYEVPKPLRWKIYCIIMCNGRTDIIEVYMVNHATHGRPKQFSSLDPVMLVELIL